MMDYLPNVRYCEVVLNGEYRGLYLMIESISNFLIIPLCGTIHSQQVAGSYGIFDTFFKYSRPSSPLVMDSIIKYSPLYSPLSTTSQ